MLQAIITVQFGNNCTAPNSDFNILKSMLCDNMKNQCTKLQSSLTGSIAFKS